MLSDMGSTSHVSGHMASFEDTVRDFWASRPRRPREGRKLAGVAAAVGDRYGIDPVLVRVALIALTVFGGIGLSVYLLGWLLLPEADDEVSGLENLLGKGRSSMSRPLALVLCVLLLPVTSWAFAGDWFDGGGFIGLALVIAAVYLLHRSRGEHNRPVAPTPTAATTTSVASAAMSSGTAPDGTAPSGWDPLGAAPLGWRMDDSPQSPLPSASEPPPSPPPRRRRVVGPATLGVALLVGGVGSALAATGEAWFTPAHVVGTVLAVLGTGLVVGSFLGGGRGLVWLAAPLAVAGLALAALPSPHLSGGVGPLDASPTTAADVRPVYERTAGPVTVDLTGLRGERPVETDVRNGAGPVTVTVPPEADVTYHCEAAMGTVNCFGRESSGVGTPALTGTDLGADGEGGQEITLRATSSAGPVEVHRG